MMSTVLSLAQVVEENCVHSRKDDQFSQTQDQDCGAVFERRVLGNGIGYERMDILHEELVQETCTQDSSNELELYLKEKVEITKGVPGLRTHFDVLSWWRRNNMKFPIMSLMLLVFLRFKYHL